MSIKKCVCCSKIKGMMWGFHWNATRLWQSAPIPQLLYVEQIFPIGLTLNHILSLILSVGGRSDILYSLISFFCFT